MSKQRKRMNAPEQRDLHALGPQRTAVIITLLLNYSKTEQPGLSLPSLAKRVDTVLDWLLGTLLGSVVLRDMEEGNCGRVIDCVVGGRLDGGTGSRKELEQSRFTPYQGWPQHSERIQRSRK